MSLSDISGIVTSWADSYKKQLSKLNTSVFTCKVYPFNKMVLHSVTNKDYSKVGESNSKEWDRYEYLIFFVISLKMQKSLKIIQKEKVERGNF